MDGSRRRPIVWSIVVLGLAVGLTSAWVIYSKRCVLRYSENLMLRGAVRDQSHWKITLTSRGQLIQASSGPLKNWYLSADARITYQQGISRRTFVASSNAPAVTRNLRLVEHADDGSYWRVMLNGRGSSIHLTRGEYKGWFLSRGESYVTEERAGASTAWNLKLIDKLSPSAFWNVSESKAGFLIQANAFAFQGWALDYFEDAHLIAEHHCLGQGTTREKQSPPLAP